MGLTGLNWWTDSLCDGSSVPGPVLGAGHSDDHSQALPSWQEYSGRHPQEGRGGCALGEVRKALQWKCWRRAFSTRQRVALRIGESSKW